MRSIRRGGTLISDTKARHHLHTKREEILDADATSTLMELLPQTTELVDKAHLDLRLSEMDARMQAMEQRLVATIHEEISKAIRPLYFAMTGAIFTSASLAFAAAQL